MHDRSQVRHTEALAVRTMTWLRDEEAIGSRALQGTSGTTSSACLIELPPA
jgi:hypothetical protein